MTLAWVVGSGGLLGSALCRALRAHDTLLHSPEERFRWFSPRELELQLEKAVSRFASSIETGDRWELYWAAGVGFMGSSDEDVVSETRTLSRLLDLFMVEPRLAATPGIVAFASSAGAIYGGSNEFVINEETPPAPSTAYARAKLEQEHLVREFALAHGRTDALLARLSTLYGPGQAHGKRQGLIAHIARRMLRNQPVQIYVPLDTVRDYVNSDDAAEAMVAMTKEIPGGGTGPRIMTRIVASERPTTIAEIVSIFKRIARRAPRIVTSASRLSGLYPRHVRFRSVAGRKMTLRPQVSILSGISAVMTAERAAFVRGDSAEGG